MKSVRLVVGLALITSLIQQPAEALTNYQQPVWFTWNTIDLDVFIVPPRHGQVWNGGGLLGGEDPVTEVDPLKSSYMRAILNSIKDWERAMVAYGSSTLKSKFGCSSTTKNCSSIKKYVIGRDIPPPGTRPDILITTDETKGFALGIAISTRPCIVLNSSFFVLSMTYEAMFGINAQEYGHCLGLAHVNEINNQGGEAPLIHDPMNGFYADDPSESGTDLHCVSNLNVKGLEEVFAQPLFGRQGNPYGQITASSYLRPRYNAGAPGWGCIY